MKELFSEMRGAIVSTLIFAIVLCGLYPLAVWGIGQLAFPHQANGSLIFDSRGRVRGSTLLGQRFTAAKYFHSRPSAAGHGYDPTSSGGSNFGPTSRKLRDAIRERVAAYRAENELQGADLIPADAVTASGSGLDPHISVRNAELQAARVAKARNVSREKILEFVRANTKAVDLGIFGETRVNVLELNLALDK